VTLSDLLTPRCLQLGIYEIPILKQISQNVRWRSVQRVPPSVLLRCALFWRRRRYAISLLVTRIDLIIMIDNPRTVSILCMWISVRQLHLTNSQLTELAMCEYSANLRRNPDWWKHFQNQDTREELARIGQQRIWTIRTPSSFADVRLSPKQVGSIYL
jgi:hypothetical protein